MLAAQTFSALCLFLWGLLATYPILWCVNKLIPIRLTPEEETMGCDFVSHYMGDEKEFLQSLDRVQIESSTENITKTTNHYNNNNEFDNLNKRKPFHVNYGYERDVSQENSSARM